MGTALTRDGRRIDFLDTSIGEGSEKEVFFTIDKKQVVCLYKNPDRRASRREQERLTKLLNEYNPTTHSVPQVADHFKRLFCWPTAIVDQPRLGIIAPTYPQQFFFTEGKKPFIIGKEKNVVYHTGKSRRFLAEEDLGNFYTKVRACLHISRAIRKLHMTGIAHTDLSNNNVLIDLRKGTAVIIDLDSAAVPGYYPPTVLGTKGYIAPEVMGTVHLSEDDPRVVTPSILTDRYALAVLIYEILFLRHPLEGRLIHDQRDAERDERLAKGERALFIEDPNDHRNRPTSLEGSPLTINHLHTLRDNFIKTFSVGLHQPRRRATAPLWESALIKTIDLTLPCQNQRCGERFFLYKDDGSRPKCPICQTRYRQPIPMIALHKPMGRGRLRASGRIAGYHRRALLEYHVYPHRSADETAENTQLARIIFHQGRWWLQNTGVTAGLRTEEGQVIPSGSALRIDTGVRVQLDLDQGYLAELTLTQ